MGALPKRKISTARKGRRRAKKKLSQPNLVECSKCGHLRRPHHACPQCGWHKE